MHYASRGTYFLFQFAGDLSDMRAHEAPGPLLIHLRLRCHSIHRYQQQLPWPAQVLLSCKGNLNVQKVSFSAFYGRILLSQGSTSRS